MDIYSDTIVYVMTPSRIWTGGPNSCNQLCQKLRQNKINAFISFYSISSTDNRPDVHPNSLIYGNPVATEIVDSPRNIMIMPESSTQFLAYYKHIRKAVWWLSVDFYYIFSYHPTMLKHKVPIVDVLDCDESITHLADCYYAKKHLELFSLPAKNILMQESYVNKAILNLVMKTKKDLPKQNYVTFNPIKGVEITKRIITYCKMRGMDHITFVPLTGLTIEKLVDVYRMSKLHIDFGPFPGREYIPREASLFDMCVLTSKRGAAKYKQDAPIPDEYKFDFDEDALPAIYEAIDECVGNYDKRISDFASYKNFTMGLERKFTMQTRENFKSV